MRDRSEVNPDYIKTRRRIFWIINRHGYLIKKKKLMKTHETFVIIECRHLIAINLSDISFREVSYQFRALLQQRSAIVWYRARILVFVPQFENISDVRVRRKRRPDKGERIFWQQRYERSREDLLDVVEQYIASN